MSVAAVLVNHNTSAYAELALRSLFAQNPDVPVSLTVFDNGSTDDRSGLLAAAERYGVPVVASGFPITTPGNSTARCCGDRPRSPDRSGGPPALPRCRHLLHQDRGIPVSRSRIDGDRRLGLHCAHSDQRYI